MKPENERRLIAILEAHTNSLSALSRKLTWLWAAVLAILALSIHQWVAP